MFGKIKIYYGLSGTFKGTTIQSVLGDWKKNDGSIKSCSSDIKKWKALDKRLFGNSTSGNNLIFANHHLCKLDSILSTSFSKSWTLLVERGISDFCYYDSGEVRQEYRDMVEYEKELLYQGHPEFVKIEKILLIQGDEKFIGETILSEPTRSHWFPDTETYLREQDKYIKFTKELNDITSEVVISDAEDYIVNTLGLQFNK